MTSRARIGKAMAAIFEGRELERSTMSWLLYALISAIAAALTAILAKVGVEGVPSNLATAIRDIAVVIGCAVIALCLAAATLRRRTP